MLESAEDKQNWEADQALPVYINVDTSGGHRVIDGLRAVTDRPYHSLWPVEDPSHPWIQVRMDNQYWVKAVKLTQRETWLKRHTHKEVMYIVNFNKPKLYCQNLWTIVICYEYNWVVFDSKKNYGFLSCLIEES